MIVPIRLVETAHFKDQDWDELDQTSSEGWVRAPYDVLPRDRENLDGLISRGHATFLVGLISSSKDFTSRALRFADYKLRSVSSVGVVSKFSYVFPFPSDIFKTLDPQFHNHDV